VFTNARLHQGYTRPLPTPDPDPDAP